MLMEMVTALKEWTVTVRPRNERRQLLMMCKGGTRWAVALVAVAMLAGCGASEGAPPMPSPQPPDLSPRPGDERLEHGRSFWGSELVELPSYPPRYLLRLRGSLPTPCHQLRVAVSRDEARAQILVEVYSLKDPGAICVQVVTPFETDVALEAVARPHEVVVNGQSAGIIGPGSGL